ncbi:MAG: peptidyl-prolyl cis-trans isomerase [Gammaproteobacteria bacterium]|nr:peptidyl-prolyl cis-trans isomerase [Gammaproteobacteria bacterium]
MLNKALRDPLTHFVVAGFAVYLLLGSTPMDRNLGFGQNIIVVDEQSVLRYIQFRNRTFDADQAKRFFHGLSDPEREEVINQSAREEALYREAIRLGIQDHDYAIRQRLVGSLEFAVRGLGDGDSPVDPDALTAFYDRHKDDYFVQPSITFTHVFLRTFGGRPDGARARLTELLGSLTNENAPADYATRFGDDFLYGANFADRTIGEVTADFGSSFADQVFDGSRHLDQWFGPIDSDHGVHLVFVLERRDGYTPSLSKIKDKLLADMAHERSVLETETRIDRIVEKYDVRVRLRNQEPVVPGMPP